MSISHIKINRMIESVVASGVASRTMKEKDFIDLCKEIYLLESSAEGSNHSKIADIKNKITRIANN